LNAAAQTRRDPRPPTTTLAGRAPPRLHGGFDKSEFTFVITPSAEQGFKFDLSPVSGAFPMGGDGLEPPTLCV
jgi:hypothetical protein